MCTAMTWTTPLMASIDQWHVQHVPQGEQALVDAELGHVLKREQIGAHQRLALRRRWASFSRGQPRSSAA